MRERLTPTEFRSLVAGIIVSVVVTISAAANADSPARMALYSALVCSAILVVTLGSIIAIRKNAEKH